MDSPGTSLDIYELLDHLRRRPGMFLGQHGTLPLLGAFLSGMETRPLRLEEPRFNDFRNWLPARIDELPDAHTCVQAWLEEQRGPEKAWDEYFRYLDEYQQNTVELLHVNAGPLTARFTLVIDGSAPSAPPIPGRLIVGRYRPSEIYFWGTQTGETVETAFPFCHSAAQAKKLAGERWDTPPRSWKKLKQPERVDRRKTHGLWRLLEAIQERPSMYCDPANKPLTTLETMLYGYAAALSDYDPPNSGFNEALRAYLLARFGWSTSCGWARAIQEHVKKGEDELSKFFAVLDEFRSDLGDPADDLDVVAARLDALTRSDGVRRRRRDSVVKLLRSRRS